jgi:4'-phosphopantetheinyl transferase
MTWCHPSESIRLTQDEVHLWRFWLNQPTPHLDTCLQCLSTDERQRAASFYAAQHRKRFIITRGTLRRILSSYLNSDPEHLVFHYTPHGKPFLHTYAEGDLELQFNIAHSQHLALCAVTLTHHVGIDVERVQNLPIQTVLHAFFPPRDAQRILSLPKSQQLTAFYEAWTRTEAYLKATGAGIYRTFPLVPSHFPRVSQAPTNDGQWTTIVFRPALAYVAALVVEGRAQRLRYLQTPHVDRDHNQFQVTMEV